MNEKKKSSEFLALSSYRQRRLRDAVVLLPIFGATLWFIPLLWDPDAVTDAFILIYVFGIWLLLIITAALIGRKLRGTDENLANTTDQD